MVTNINFPFFSSSIVILLCSHRPPPLLAPNIQPSAILAPDNRKLLGRKCEILSGPSTSTPPCIFYYIQLHLLYLSLSLSFLICLSFSLSFLICLSVSHFLLSLSWSVSHSLHLTLCTCLLLDHKHF